MNNKPTILGKTYDYGYDGRDHVETISVPLYLDGKGYDIELNVYGQGQTAEEADIDAKNAEMRLIEELKRIVKKYQSRN